MHAGASATIDRALSPEAESDRPIRRALVVVNPRSRSGAAKLPSVIDELAACGIDCLRVDETPGPALTARLVELAPSADVLVVAGGDGTLNAVASSLLATGLPLGIVPAGTGNDLARTLGLPHAPRAAARVVAGGRIRAIDLGDVDGHPFFNVAGLGLSVRLQQHLTPPLKRRFGRAGYVLAALRAMLGAAPFAATVRGDDGRELAVRALQISIGNGRHYGGGLVVADGAAIDDGVLDLCALELSGPLRLLGIVGPLVTGRWQGVARVRTLRGHSFEIRTAAPLPIDADGELIARTPARIRVLPGAVRVLVP